jgi:ATP-dependent Clp protease protease subunit
MNTVISETTEHGEIPVDVYQKLSNDIILFICHELNDQIATDIVATLLLKDLEDSTKKITIFINSPGGSIRNAFMICDMINIIESPVETVCIGSAFNEVAVILASGTPGMRFATKNSIIAMNQLSHDYFSQGDLTDAKKLLNLSLIDNKKMMEMISKTSNKTIKQVVSDFDRQVFMTPSQACKYGLIDKIITVGK